MYLRLLRRLIRKVIIEWAKKVGAFWRFLNQLDPSKFEIYYQEEDNGHTAKTGWLVVHFPEKITEKWNDTWQTWFGISVI
jgi:hypothetical protein